MPELYDVTADKKCPHCGGGSLMSGNMNTDASFAPSLPGWWGITRYRQVKACVCPDCGVPTQYLSRQDVQDLRSKEGSRGE